MSETKQTVYILGPMRGKPRFNFSAFFEAADNLRAAGFNVFNPAEEDINIGIDPFKLPEDWDWNELPADWVSDDFIARDVAGLQASDLVYCLPGWQNSVGARGEHALAQWLGLSEVKLSEQGVCVYTLEDIPVAVIPEQDKVSILKNTDKLTNPKDVLGSDKLPLHLWPTTATAMGCIWMLNGALKYGRGNFRVAGVRASIYYDAAMRHMNAWFEGEENDPDDDVPHLAAALACLAIIVDARAAGKLNDDRAVKGGYRQHINALTVKVPELKKRHEKRNPKSYSIEDNQ